MDTKTFKTDEFDIIDKLKTIDKLHNEVYSDIVEFMFSKRGKKPFVFTDETGYPTYYDDNSDETESVVSAYSDGKTLFFNINATDESWFDPNEYGEFDIHNFFECVLAVIDDDTNS